jgi:hypothetical protein
MPVRPVELAAVLAAAVLLASMLSVEFESRLALFEPPCMEALVRPRRHWLALATWLPEAYDRCRVSREDWSAWSGHATNFPHNTHHPPAGKSAERC